MFEDIDGNRYFADKIVKISKSQDRGVRDGLARFEHQVWILGQEEPVWVDYRWVENLDNTQGRVIPCGGDYFLVDFSNELGNPELIAVVGWLVPLASSSDLTPITVNGINNGNPDTFLPILHPDGKSERVGSLARFAGRMHFGICRRAKKWLTPITTSLSSAPAPAAMSRRSAQRSLA